MAKMTVTPELAKGWLGSNSINRNVKRTVVERYTRDILEGRWVYNGSSIVIATSGRLLDGQHRLHAIVEADTPIECEVITDVDEEAFVTIDSGSSRTAADVLHIRGFPNAAVLASIARASIVYLGGASMRGKVTNAEVESFVAEHERLHDVARLATRAHGVVSPAALGSVYFLATATANYYPKMSEFVDGVVSGEGLAKEDARLVVRNTIYEYIKRGKGGLPRDYAMTLCAFGWNAFVADNPARNLRFAVADRGVGAPDIIGAPRRGAGRDAMPVGSPYRPFTTKAVQASKA